MLLFFFQNTYFLSLSGNLGVLNACGLVTGTRGITAILLLNRNNLILERLFISPFCVIVVIKLLDYDFSL